MSFLPFLTINGRKIGPGEPVYLIAELSANHCQDYSRAERMIIAAKEAGADAVKLQTYTPDTITLDSHEPCFIHSQKSLWAGKTLYQLYQEAYTPWEWQPRLKQLADNINIDLFSSPFDPTAVDFLEQLQVPAYKIASFEIIDIPLIEKAATTGKPLIISTGMASRQEIEDAITAAHQSGATEIALLKCSSAYPAPVSSMNLRSIPDMAKYFGVPVGLSDHTRSHIIATASITLGACLIEKHFTLDRSQPSADAAFSLDPKEFRQLVENVRTTEQALGQVFYGPTEQESESLKFRRSLFVVENIQSGELLTNTNIRSIRPAGGLPPKMLRDILGRKARNPLNKGTPLRLEDLE